jgi:hypothetical protein
MAGAASKWFPGAGMASNTDFKSLACLHTFFHIKIHNNVPLKMPLNIACFIAVCQPSDIVLYSFGAAVADRISAFLFPTPFSGIYPRSLVDERFSFCLADFGRSG